MRAGKFLSRLVHASLSILCSLDNMMQPEDINGNGFRKSDSLKRRSFKRLQKDRARSTSATLDGNFTPKRRVWNSIEISKLGMCSGVVRLCTNLEDISFADFGSNGIQNKILTFPVVTNFTENHRNVIQERNNVFENFVSFYEKIRNDMDRYFEHVKETEVSCLWNTFGLELTALFYLFLAFVGRPMGFLCSLSSIEGALYCIPNKSRDRKHEHQGVLGLMCEKIFQVGLEAETPTRY